MEERRENLKLGEVSFMPPHRSSPYNNGGFSTVAQKHLLANKGSLNGHQQPLETPKSHDNAMEFLCRPWSSSATNFLQMFSSSNLLLPLSDGNETEDNEKQLEETLKKAAERNRLLTIRDNNRKMGLNPIKQWLKGKPLTDFFLSRKERRKEEVRFHTAKLDAALSLTRLAAAIAGFATTTSIEAQEINHKNNGETGAQHKGMRDIVATAATLMTTVWAEAAESLGADRAQVASAVNSGLTIHTPIDMMAVTATAATCLRGAAIVKSRMVADSFSTIQEVLKLCNQMCIISPSGNKEYKCVTVYSKHNHIILCFRKKYLGGTLTISRQYKVICIEGTMQGEGHYFLSLKTNIGVIKLLFEDETQLSIWLSTISNLLMMHNRIYQQIGHNHFNVHHPITSNEINKFE